MEQFMKPAYKQATFWTFIVSVLVSLGVGFGYDLEVEMLAAISAQLIAYLTATGILKKAEIQAIAGIRASQIYQETEMMRFKSEATEK